MTRIDNAIAASADVATASPPSTQPPPPSTPATSLALRLTLLFVVTALLIVTAVSSMLYVALAGSLAQEQDQFLNNKVRILAQQLLQRPPDLNAMKEEVEEDFAPQQYARVFARVIGERERVIVESPQMTELLPPGAFPPPMVRAEMPAAGTEFRTAGGTPYRALAVIVPSDSASGGGRIQVALDQTSSAHLLSRYRRQIAAIVAITLVLSTALGYGVSRRALRPLRDISAAAQRVQPTALTQRIDTARLPRELCDVALRFNGMLDRLEESFDRLTHFSVELAHELRTPLSNLQSLLEQSLLRDRSPDDYRSALSSAMEECTRLGRIIDGLLFIARADDPRTQIRREPIDVAAELRRMTEMYQVLASEHDVRLALHCDASGRGLVAPLDRTLLQRAIDNLIANATAHTPPGGSIELRAARANGFLRITVADTGAGIAADDLPRVFDRFYRGRPPGDQRRAGRVGMGLSIVRGIMALHGGTVTVDSKTGAGTSVRLEFPC